ncbi:VOC family protein [Tropicimonas sp. IMCC34043]|uniref:VOC family protein n=1 Tax=Tropicimonas sp. IMCC34043 TaxID=2248760 RepID=UPI000E2417F0|nr:VOC family protein [Tropicimonas sp. IMCC34043]
MTEQCPVVHFEMPYEDAGRIAGFYETAFGWKLHQLGPEMGDYVTAETAESRDGRSVTPGVINGGFFAKTPDLPAQHPSVVIGVSDIAAAMTRLTEAGGTVLGEPMEIPGVGLYVAFTDTEGNRASLLQPVGQG